MTEKPTSRFHGPGMITQCWFLAASDIEASDEPQASSFKLQASSFKLTLAGFKLVACGSKLAAAFR
jgi:hypothetical protein